MDKFKESDILNFPDLIKLTTFLFGHKGFIAGGCFKNIFNHEPVKDIDMFFESAYDFEVAKNYFRELITVDSKNWQQSYENKKVWAVYSVENDVRIELIRSVFGKPQKIISDFDFTITKFAFYVDTDKGSPDKYLSEYQVVYHDDFFEHLHTKRLVIDADIPFPVSTFNRSYKYSSYGYGLCKESKVKLLSAIHDLPALNTDEIGMSLYDGKD